MLLAFSIIASKDELGSVSIARLTWCAVGELFVSDARFPPDSPDSLLRVFPALVTAERREERSPSSSTVVSASTVSTLSPSEPPAGESLTALARRVLMSPSSCGGKGLG
jgi:hypothetical protein